MGEKDPKNLKTVFADNTMKYLSKNLAYPFEYFYSIDDYHKPVDNLKKEDAFSKLKNDYPSVKEIDRTKVISKSFDNKKGEELTQLYLKSDVLKLICAFEKFIKVSINEFGINPLYCVSLPGQTWQSGFKYTGINLQTLQDKDLILTLENNLRGGTSSVMEDRYKKQLNIKRHFIWMLPVFMGILWSNIYLMMRLKCGMVILIFIWTN